MLRDYLDRVAVATGGKSAVLLLTPIPGALERYDSEAPVADIIREAAAQRGLPCCDLHSAFKALGAERVGAMMDSANVHPNAEGQELIARTIADALNSQPSTLNPSL